MCIGLCPPIALGLTLGMQLLYVNKLCLFFCSCTNNNSNLIPKGMNLVLAIYILGIILVLTI